MHSVDWRGHHPPMDRRDSPCRPNVPAGGHDRARGRLFGARGSPTTPTARRASASVLCGVFRADLHEIGRFEGLDLQPDTYGRSAVHW